jgi:hypothetical protein
MGIACHLANNGIERLCISNGRPEQILQAQYYATELRKNFSPLETRKKRLRGWLECGRLSGHRMRKNDWIKVKPHHRDARATCTCPPGKVVFLKLLLQFNFMF